MKAKGFIDKGELVPDNITIPMILQRIKQADCNNGWLLDGFPRSPNQAEALWQALEKESVKLNCVVEIVLDRSTVRKRILGRRVCVRDGNHPNNIGVEAITPEKKGTAFVCRVCGSELQHRADDADEQAVDKRHNIYYDEKNGTLGAVLFFKSKVKLLQVDGMPSVKDVAENLKKQLKFTNTQFVVFFSLLLFHSSFLYCGVIL